MNFVVASIIGLTHVLDGSLAEVRSLQLFNAYFTQAFRLAALLTSSTANLHQCRSLSPKVRASSVMQDVRKPQKEHRSSSSNPRRENAISKPSPRAHHRSADIHIMSRNPRLAEPSLFPFSKEAPAIQIHFTVARSTPSEPAPPPSIRVRCSGS